MAHFAALYSRLICINGSEAVTAKVRPSSQLEKSSHNDGARCMIKDILVSLPVGATSSDAAVDYAISMATGFDAHLAGLALTYQPYVPGNVFNGVAANIVASYRAQLEKASKEI